MPKGGSGFMKAAGRAAAGIAAGRGSAGKSNYWSVEDAQGVIEDVKGFYARTYRNGDVVFKFDGRGRIVDLNFKSDRAADRFYERADALAKEISGKVLVGDDEARKQYNALRSYVGKIKTTEAERKEFYQKYEGDRYLPTRPGASMRGADVVAMEMAQKGLISHDIPAMTNNVDILGALHDAVNTAKSQALSPIALHGKAAREDFQADIFEGLTSRYVGVVRDAMKRQKK